MDHDKQPGTIRPESGDYAAYFERYVALVPDGQIIETLEAGLDPMVGIFSRILPGREGFSYAAGKWTIREVLGHIIDTERVFAYRALRVARGDATPLTSFDQDLFVAGGDFEQVRLADLIEEFVAVRRATIALFRNLSPAALDRRGTVGENPLTARAAAWMIAGHQLYHEALLRERYADALGPTLFSTN